MQVVRVEVEVRVSGFVQRLIQERLDLAIKSLVDAAHLRAEDTGLLTDRGHEGFNLAGRDALETGLYG